MTISQAISKLTEFEKEGHGNVEICSVVHVDERFCIEFGRIFDLIEIPEDGQDNLVCAYMDEPDLDEGEYPPLRPVC